MSNTSTYRTGSIAELERHMALRPGSPLFARLAALYIENNRPAQALKICLQGMRSHPEYPTGLLMIARAQVMLRQYSDARETLHELLRVLPGCAAARALMERMTELELEYPPYTTTGAVFLEKSGLQREDAGDRRQQWSRQDDILPGFTVRQVPESEPAAEEQTPAPPPDRFDLAVLAQRLESARIPSLPEDEAEDEAAVDDDVEEVNLEARPVTETLISIYVQQGRIREAIDAYRRLAERHADRRTEFEERIRELEQRLEDH